MELTKEELASCWKAFRSGKHECVVINGVEQIVINFRMFSDILDMDEILDASPETMLVVHFAAGFLAGRRSVQ